MVMLKNADEEQVGAGNNSTVRSASSTVLVSGGGRGRESTLEMVEEIVEEVVVNSEQTV